MNFRDFLHCLFFRTHIPYKIINGYKVHFTGPMSVNRGEAILANWENIKKIQKSFDRK